MNKLSNYLYYVIIALVSIITIAVFPMMGSEADLAIVFPNTIGGWIVYIGTMLATATANMMIFFGFMNQARLNVKDNAHYKEAEAILLDLSLKRAVKEKLPRSPHKWNATQYSRKGVTLFVGSLASGFALTNAILQFNVVTLISYTITVIFAILFGIFQMKTAERYWTDEYYRYAKYEQQVYEQTEEKHD